MICYCNNKIKYKTKTSIGKPGFKSYMLQSSADDMGKKCFASVLSFSPLPSSELKTWHIFTVRRPRVIKPTPLVTGPLEVARFGTRRAKSAAGAKFCGK